MNTSEKTWTMPWWAVIIQKEDGHDIDAGFITNNENSIKIFRASVSPYIVYDSECADKEECSAVIEEIEAANNAAGSDFLNLTGSDYLDQMMV